MRSFDKGRYFENEGNVKNENRGGGGGLSEITVIVGGVALMEGGSARWMGCCEKRGVRRVGEINRAQGVERGKLIW